jgi:uncharacterized repeat protein (TIGR03803 family)
MTAYKTLICLTLCAAAIPSSAQTFNTLVNFDGSNGSGPYLMSLTQGTDGMFYGSTRVGGTYGSGSIFKMSPDGTVTTLHNFCRKTNCPDGRGPIGALLLGTDGDFYGTTEFGGGKDDDGTVFKITAAGKLTTLVSFDGTNGASPYAGLIQVNGDFYGTTEAGGTNDYGTVFKITPSGTLTSLHSFSFSVDGAEPQAALVEATNGDLYGTTYQGGPTTDYGTLFKITTGGTLTTLHNFQSTDGAYPRDPLIQAANGKLYGTTYNGGANGYGAIFDATLAGAVTLVYSFGSTDGADPIAGLIQATDGNFYGATPYTDGETGYGIIFRITAGGTPTTLHTFASTDGAYPDNGLVQGTDGSFYGTTYEGGTDNIGTVFNLSVGLGPFVRTVPTSGKTGSAVKILGSDLTGATSVTFNGVAAAFTVVSATEITATVPASATTGKVKVVTPGGTLSSNVVFRVP